MCPDELEMTAAARAAHDSEMYMHENCDEALFRPVVTVHGTIGEEPDRRGSSLDRLSSVPAATNLINRELIVPVIEEKDLVYFSKTKRKEEEDLAKFEELSTINKMSKREPVAKAVPQVVEQKMMEDFVNVEIAESSTIPDKEKAKKERKKKATDSESIEVIEIENPVEEVMLPPVEKAARSKKKENGKKKEEPKQQPQQPQQRHSKSPPVEIKPARNAASSGASAGTNNRKEPKQDNRKRKEKRQSSPPPPPPPTTPPMSEPEELEPEFSVARTLSEFCGQAEDEMLKSICDEFPPLEALKIDDLELFGEANEPENLKVTRTEISVQESMLASIRAGNDELLVAGGSELATGNVGRAQSAEKEYKSKKSVGAVSSRDERKSAKEDEFYDFSSRYEMDFGQPLPPLEPFVCKDFEDLGVDEDVRKSQVVLKQPSVEKTLINFESPLQEEADELSAKRKSILFERDIVFAMCTSLREAIPSVMGESSSAQYSVGSRSLTSSMIQSESVALRQQVSVEAQDSDYKSLELEVDDCAILTSQLPISSASDEDTSNSNNEEEEVKIVRKIPPAAAAAADDEDEELQPLISSSKTSSSSLSTTVISTVAGGGLTDSLSSSMTTSGIVAAVGSPAKTPTHIITTSALPTTEANQSEDSDKQNATAADKQTNSGSGTCTIGNGSNGNGNGKKKSKKKRK